MAVAFLCGWMICHRILFPFENCSTKHPHKGMAKPEGSRRTSQESASDVHSGEASDAKRSVTSYWRGKLWQKLTARAIFLPRSILSGPIFLTLHFITSWETADPMATPLWKFFNKKLMQIPLFFVTNEVWCRLGWFEGKYFYVKMYIICSCTIFLKCKY